MSSSTLGQSHDSSRLHRDALSRWLLVHLPTFVPLNQIKQSISVPSFQRDETSMFRLVIAYLPMAENACAISLRFDFAQVSRDPYQRLVNASSTYRAICVWKCMSREQHPSDHCGASNYASVFVPCNTQRNKCLSVHLLPSPSWPRCCTQRGLPAPHPS